MVTCPECLKDFEPNRIGQVFCSQLCAARCNARRMSHKKLTGVTLKCHTCGKEFYVPKRLAEQRRFCSRECAVIHTNQLKKTGDNKACETCGKLFYSTPARYESAKYCSDSCRDQRRLKLMKGKCLTCGNDFEYQNMGAPRKYCSEKCGRVARKFLIRKDRKWQNRELRTFAERCQMCGYEAHKEILGVHHIDKNPKNNDSSNLIVLCPNCHSVEHSVHICHNRGLRDGNSTTRKVS